MFCFIGSQANPDEEKLYQHLFENRSYNFNRTPIHNKSESVNVNITLKLIRIISLVNQKYLTHFVYRYASENAQSHCAMCILQETSRNVINNEPPFLTTNTIRYDTIEEFNVDLKAEYSALSSTRSQKKKLKQTTPVPL